jgi:ketosteroid isomerase-like protein
MTDNGVSDNVALVRRYFDVIDGRSAVDIRDLFAADVQLYFSKRGIVYGADVLPDVMSGASHTIRYSTHHVDELNVIEQGDTIVVEGTTEGETVKGQRWDGRKTKSGRFCNVFEVRMHVYLDPDFGAEDTGRDR